MAGEPVGEVWADVRFRGDKAPLDVEKVLTKAEKDGDAKIAEVGDTWGHTLDKHIQRETRNTGHDLAESISQGLEREGLKIAKMVVEVGPNGQIGRRWITTVGRELERSVADDVAAGASGILGHVGQAISDGIGAGFNISGKSPLIAILIPVFGAIAEVILSAVQAAGALVAVLTLIPSLLFAVGLQAGALLLVFHGLMTAIPAAFAAKNVDEFNAAIKDLSPAAQDFVRSLLPLRDFFHELSNLTQSAFFKGFGDALTKFVHDVGQPWLSVALPAIAEHLGTIFRTILSFFSSSQFAEFIAGIIPQITRFLDVLGPQLYEFLFGLTTFANSLRPFLQWFGDSFATALGDIGFWLNNLAHDQGFLDWLDQMKTTWSLAGQVLGEFLKLVAAIFYSLNKSGAGNNALDKLADTLSVLAGFFASDLGVKAMEGLVTLAIALTELFAGLVVSIGLLFFLFQTTWDFIIHAIPAFFANLPGWIGDFFAWLGRQILDFFAFIGKAIKDFVVNLGTNITDFINGIVNFIITLFPFLIENGRQAFVAIGDHITNFIAMAGDNIAAFFTKTIPDFFSSLPSKAADAFGSLYDVFMRKGHDLMEGLIRGIQDKLGPLGSVMGFVAGKIGGFLPSSPAKEGPLSGYGDPLKAGQRISERIAAGIEIGAPDIAAASTTATSNIALGAGAVQMNFYGPTPTAAQAAAAGQAAGSSLADVLALRDTRLAVRTLSGAY